MAYASSATRLITQVDLEHILDVSRVRNSAVGVTGLLLYRGGNFLQALEGPEDAVRATMLRISRDRRHRSVISLHEGRHDGRLFGEWSMAFEQAAALDETLHPGLSTYLNIGDAAVSVEASEHDVFEFFRAFRDYLR